MKLGSSECHSTFAQGAKIHLSQEIFKR